MQTVPVTMPASEARSLYREYKKHLHYSSPIDRECLRAYQLLAQGKVIIKALESITAAGLNVQGLPKLAIAPATALSIDCQMRRGGGCVMDARKEKSSRWRLDENKWCADRSYFQFPQGSFAVSKEIWRATALVPGIPLHLKPRRGIENYHILWEAEWTRIVPTDPFLLRRIGKADLWLVVAAWDLTEVERGALSLRI